MADGDLIIYDIKGNKVGSADVVDGEVIFRSSDHEWVWVLDARHEPYDELDLKTVLHRAAEVRKRFVLVAAKPEEAPE